MPIKVTDNWNEGECVLFWGTNTITDKESGVKIPIHYHTASLVDDGKILAIYYFYDNDEYYDEIRVHPDRTGIIS